MIILLPEIFKEMSCYNVKSLENLYFKSCAKKRDKVSIAITSSNFIVCSLLRCYFMLSLSNLHQSKSNQIFTLNGYTIKQLAADDILLFIAICQNFTWQIKPRHKSKSEWTSIHMSLNPGLNQAQKVIFSWKIRKSFHSKSCFNIDYLQKFYLNEKLNLYYHIQ